VFTTDVPREKRKQRGLDIFERMRSDGEKGTVKFDDLDCAIHAWPTAWTRIATLCEGLCDYGPRCEVYGCRLIPDR
jgi:hypothetical protein